MKWSWKAVVAASALSACLTTGAPARACTPLTGAASTISFTPPDIPTVR